MLSSSAIMKICASVFKDLSNSLSLFWSKINKKRKSRNRSRNTLTKVCVRTDGASRRAISRPSTTGGSAPPKTRPLSKRNYPTNPKTPVYGEPSLSGELAFEGSAKKIRTFRRRVDCKKQKIVCATSNEPPTRPSLTGGLSRAATRRFLRVVFP